MLLQTGSKEITKMAQTFNEIGMLCYVLTLCVLYNVI